MNIVLTGSDRPSLKELDNHVVMEVADKWKSLGVVTEYLDPLVQNFLKYLDPL